MDITKRIFIYEAASNDEGRPVRDIILKRWRMVHHDVARAKYDTPGGITVNGETVFINRKLHEGDVLKVILTDFPPEKIIPVEHPIEVVYEDEDIICLNKPAGIVAHPSHGHYSDSLANYLAYYFQMKHEPHEIRTIGRLDKDTSGLILFAKSRTMSAHLTRQSEEGVHTKTYYALAEGVFSERTGRIEAPIAREFEGEQKRIACEGGDYALTEYEVMNQYEEYALLRVRIATGRTHQIRVHMNHIGHPLLGDPIYNPNWSGHGISRAALHAGEVTFCQPFSGEMISLRAEMPEDFLRMCCAEPCQSQADFLKAVPSER